MHLEAERGDLLFRLRCIPVDPERRVERQQRKIEAFRFNESSQERPCSGVLPAMCRSGKKGEKWPTQDF
jgi:hypothetical protein